jgi:prepilin-type N-terminal cleavage/methylation domain-containing protein
MKLARHLKQKGFTLIELLVVIGILAILLAITLVALNPRRNFQQANDTQRQSDVNAILNAINQYAATNHGQLPAGITTTPKTITSTVGVGNVNLCAALVPTYIADLPIDPVNGAESPTGSVCTTALATYDTGYTVVATDTANGDRVTVSATGEITASISVTR